MSNIDEDIRLLREEIARLNTSLVENEFLLRNKIKEKYRNSNVYGIYAKPSDSRHVGHMIVYFSTIELAKSFLKGMVTSIKDGCTWYYQIHVVDGNILSDHQLKKIDVVDGIKFPY
jgi:hypothetical protein